jgi:hypothetical protein
MLRTPVKVCTLNNGLVSFVEVSRDEVPSSVSGAHSGQLVEKGLSVRRRLDIPLVT